MPARTRVAMVKKALITPIRERWVVNVRGGPDLEVQGNILDHEYRIGEGRDTIAEVSKKWFRLRDTYGVEIDPGQDDALILAVCVCIDEMAHPTALTGASSHSNRLAEACQDGPGEFVLCLNGSPGREPAQDECRGNRRPGAGWVGGHRGAFVVPGLHQPVPAAVASLAALNLTHEE